MKTANFLQRSSAGMADIISLANAVPTSSEGNNDSPKKQDQPLRNNPVLDFVTF